MSARKYLDVDPRTLRLPPSRSTGADSVKLQRQIDRYGNSTVGMPRLIVYRAIDGELRSSVSYHRPGVLIRR